MKNLLLTVSLMLITAHAQAEIQYPARFTCVDENQMVDFQAEFSTEPVVPQPRGSSSIGTFKLNGVNALGAYAYHRNCFISRANEQICHVSKDISFSAQGVNLSFHGYFWIYDDSVKLSLHQYLNGEVTSTQLTCTVESL